MNSDFEKMHIDLIKWLVGCSVKERMESLGGSFKVSDVAGYTEEATKEVVEFLDKYLEEYDNERHRNN